ncbi:hypothetical protein DKX38_028802 [Salix brachista]|uniref:Retrovirus-related Pol polyprotein from transposon TNT 1-94-like beta-barrel domain-containing protein n=1 Tax=Salix brachista TaxID=2182728 RepID=A0A5N5J257_9ROSI|nr:hypothetical protein DKX38_028802 [Salix brachista]
MSKGGLQHMNIPLEEEINKEEEASNDFKEEELGIQASEEEVVETPPEEDEDNNLLLPEEEEAVTITVIRETFSVINAINLGIIALNAGRKLHYIADVYYIPAIKHNMLSIGQLLEKGYTLFMKDCHVAVKDNNGRLIAFVKMSKNRMFPLNIQYDAAKCLTAITNNLILEDEAGVPTVLVEDPRVPEEEPQSPADMSKGGLQHMNIPLEEEINKEEEASNDFKEEELGIQASEEEVVETPPEEDEDNNLLLPEEEEAVTITVIRETFSVINAINLGIIALNAGRKLHYIADVYYIPAIKHNMLSIGQLLEKGYTLFMKDCHVAVKDNNGRLIAFVKMSKNRMFPLNIQYDAAKCLTAITNNLILEDEAGVPTVLVEDPRVPEEEPQSPIEVHAWHDISRLNMSKGGLQHMNIPLEEEINKEEEASNDFKEEELGIQASEEEVVETPPEEDEDNNLLLPEEEEAVTITVIRETFSVINAINLGIIALNAGRKLQ